MSESVIEKGNLKLIKKLDSESLEEQCKRILNNRINNCELDYYESYKQALLSEFYYNYYIYNNDLYNLNYSSSDAYEDIAEGEIKEDGSINFLVSYYNGGACLHEMLHIVMDKIKREEDTSKIDNKKIMSTCLECGSNDISIREDIDYDYEEKPYVLGYYLKCNNCGNTTER